MIKYIQHTDIDKAAWDKCIASAVNSSIYAYSWYLDIIADNWDALVEDDYDSVFPLPVRKKFGITYLYQPPFAQQLGLFSKGLLSSSALERFLKAIPAHIKYIDIHLNSLNKLNNKDYLFQERINHELDLIHTHEELYIAYSKNLKRNIKKASTKGIQLMKQIKPDELVDMFRNNKGKSIQTLGDQEYRRLNRLLFTLLHKGRADVIGAFSPPNNLCAGAVFAKNNKKRIFLFSATSPEALDSGAMPYLIDNYIQHHAPSQLTLDFEGSMDPMLARFYKSFGSTVVYYPHIRINRLNYILQKTLVAYKNLMSAEKK